MSDYEVTPPPDRLSDHVQLRSAFTAHRGELVRFMVQLEYWYRGEWTTVVRYDHDRDAPGGHDVTEEGLHVDVYRDCSKVAVKDVSGPLPASDGFEAAEGDLRENVQRYIKRFERWHDITRRNDL